MDKKSEPAAAVYAALMLILHESSANQARHELLEEF
jgi:hypothetical protein